MHRLETIKEKFIYDGEEIQILSGAIHYFRVVPEYWRDRLLKLKACGFNTVETYVAWNMHEPEPGKFCFEGMADLVQFIKTAQEVGLFVIFRPGPYICAEWEFGGLPYWLLNEPDIEIRCFNEPFLKRVDAFFDQLFSRVQPLLISQGGPIIAVQVENEYGSYGNDKEYLNYLKEGMIRRGVDVLLFTSDGPGDRMLDGGTLPQVLKTVNFGSRPEAAFQKLKEHQEDMPLMCMEFWNGWFDQWGTQHHVRDGEEVAEVLEQMLQAGASVNFYMFHGGTNFGFLNGANYDEKLSSTITSYDYDAPLNEAGDLTEKYFAIKKKIAKYFGIENTQFVENSPKKAYGKVELTKQVGLMESLDVLSKPVESAQPIPMEKMGQDYGYILYRTHVNGPQKNCNLNILEVHDRAQIFVNGDFKGVIERDNKTGLKIDIPEGEAILDILVENMGRINYGSHMGDLKGIIKGVRLEYQFLFHWTIYTLPLKQLEKLKFKEIEATNAPAFYKGTFYVEEKADTFLEMEGWEKGVAFINGFNLGRYWSIGPQKTLYIPAPLLKEGENEIILFELHSVKEYSVQLLDKPNLGAVSREDC